MVAPVYTVFTLEYGVGCWRTQPLFLLQKGTASHLTLGISVNAEWEKGNAVSKQPSAQKETFKSICGTGKKSVFLGNSIRDHLILKIPLNLSLLFGIIASMIISLIHTYAGK